MFQGHDLPSDGLACYLHEGSQIFIFLPLCPLPSALGLTLILAFYVEQSGLSLLPQYRE